MEEPELKDGVAMCPKCSKNPATAPHTCPFKVEVNEDEELCCCCEECEDQCAWDV